MQQWDAVGLFVLGGTAYMGIELAWRGSTHWSMFLAGGACLCLLGWLNNALRAPLPVCAAVGALGVTAVELVAGLVCTRVWHLRVWDYSKEWGNLAGLICPRYTLLWFMLCFWVLLSMRSLQRLFS